MVTLSDVPILRLMEMMVRSGLTTACRLAPLPTSRSPVLVKPTTDGVVRLPSAFGDDGRLAAFQNGDDGVGRSQVNSYCLCHVLSASCVIVLKIVQYLVRLYYIS